MGRTGCRRYPPDAGSSAAATAGWRPGQAPRRRCSAAGGRDRSGRRRSARRSSRGWVPPGTALAGGAYGLFASGLRLPG